MLVRQSNSFDLLRMLFALFVIFDHSYAVCGIDPANWLSMLSRDLLTFGSLAVYGFFSISGFLVIQSLERSANAGEFIMKRGFRIYPGLFVVLTVILLLGWAVYAGTFQAYIHDRNIYTYFAKNVLLMDKAFVFGMFENIPVKNFINVPLWTIPYEVFLYVALSTFFLIPKKHYKGAAVVLYLLCLTGLILHDKYPHHFNKHFETLHSKDLFRFGAYFFGGAILGTSPFFIHQKRKGLILFLLILLLLVFSFGMSPITLNIILPPLIIALGIGNPGKWISNILHKSGDISYGIYLYGFPVQQTLFYFFHFSFWQLFLSASAISMLLGYLSWHLVENKALAFIRRKTTRLPYTNR